MAFTRCAGLSHENRGVNIVVYAARRRDFAAAFLYVEDLAADFQFAYLDMSVDECMFTDYQGRCESLVRQNVALSKPSYNRFISSTE